MEETEQRAFLPMTAYGSVLSGFRPAFSEWADYNRAMGLCIDAPLVRPPDVARFAQPILPPTTHACRKDTMKRCVTVRGSGG